MTMRLPYAVSVVVPVLSTMRRLARTSHRETRFHADSRFDPDRVALLYETWIEKSCRGYADAVFILELNGEAAGQAWYHLWPSEIAPGSRFDDIVLHSDVLSRVSHRKLERRT